MFDALVPLVKAVLVVPITLLPIINPPSVAPVFLATAGTDDATIVRLARQVAFNAFFLLVGSLLVGFVDTAGRTVLPHLFREVLPPQFASAAGPAVASIAVYLLMAVVLFVKPQGLFPARG